MGFLSCLEPHHTLAAPDSPPELVSPTSSSSSSRRSPITDRSRSVATPVSPPMSNYDRRTSDSMSSKFAGGGPGRHDAPRTQLPSLSSLFPSCAPGRPPAGPLSLADHLGPISSPLDRPRTTTGNPDRAYHTTPTPSSSSYFSRTLSPPAPAVSQPRSVYDQAYESPYDRERPPLPSRSSSGGPRSPMPDHYLRPEAGPSSKWSSPYDSGSRRHEYLLGGREVPLLQPSHDRPPPSYAPPRDVNNHGYRPDARVPHSQAGNPPTAAATMTPDPLEGITMKDGLGPKIWTGTHYLPRFVRQAEVPGEGLCYFYDDGSHCKTVIDGETVNALWGVTKAGKPRKRLAIACMTCREKKIKCDPDFPRCVQCQKFGRVCQFKNAPRGGHNTSPSSSPSELDDHRRFANPVQPVEYHHRPAGSLNISISTRPPMRPASPPDLPMAQKRIRVDYGSYSPVPSEPSLPPPPPLPMSMPVPRGPEMMRPNSQWQPQPAELPRLSGDVRPRPWQADP